ncbi:hypothetical protein FACS189456_4950 [Bacteroidia bacterium]|nr:hypothetical protein FACS189456_4950 [Bacteroidia bacterium]
MKKNSFMMAAGVVLAASVMVASCGGQKSASSSAAADAKTETKRLEKEGWQVAPGAIPMLRQLEESYTLQYEKDEMRQPKYITGDAMSIGGNYDAAKMQATEIAKFELAGKIATTVMAIIQNNVANEQLEKEQAASITQSVAATKNVIAQKLGRTIPLVELYRTKANKNKEVRVILGYNQESALEAAKEAVREDLAKKGDALQSQLDNLFKLNK